MAVFDQFEWHRDAAVERGQPAAAGFAHIGLYLQWLIRHGLHDPAAIPESYAEAIATEVMRGSDLHDLVGGRLSSDVLSDEGDAFTAWYYPRYLDDFASTFAGSADYSVPDDAEAYARIAPTIDRRHEEWLASGLVDDGPPITIPGDLLGRMTPADIMDAARELAEAIGGDELAEDSFGDDHLEPGVVGHGNGSPHVAPDLEALLPLEVDGTRLQITSAHATDWQSSLLRQAIENVGADPAEAFVALALGGTGTETLALTLYAIPGVPQDRLEAEFSREAYLADGHRWERREVHGKSIWWSTANEFDTAFYALGGLVITAGGSPDRVRAALEVLP